MRKASPWNARGSALRAAAAAEKFDSAGGAEESNGFGGLGGGEDGSGASAVGTSLLTRTAAAIQGGVNNNDSAC